MKIRRKSLLTALFVSLLITSQVWAAGIYGGGDGSIANPFQIATVAHLNEMHYHSEDYGKHFEMTADVDMSAYTYSTAVISPDTDNTNTSFGGVKFSGSFNGKDHIISNLTINTAGAGNDYLGLFGQIENSNCLIHNIGLVNVSITGAYESFWLGALCGHNESATINNCYATGSITASRGDYIAGLCGSITDGIISNCHANVTISKDSHRSLNIGGLCGYMHLSNISNCYAAGNITGGYDSNYIGGLCGQNSGGNISNCYAAGDISGGDDSLYVGGFCGSNGGDITNCFAIGSVTTADVGIGGLCGSNTNGNIRNSFAAGDIAGLIRLGAGGLCGTSQNGAVSNCYATGSVEGNDNSYRIGGLCGYTNISTVENCYTVGPVSGGTGSYDIGGLCGYDLGGTEYNGCFWDTQTSIVGTSVGGTGKTTAEMMTQSTYTDAGWDFMDETMNGSNDIWKIENGNDYPHLNFSMGNQSLAGDYWHGWIGANASSYSAASDSGEATISETTISLDYIGEEGVPTQEVVRIHRNWYDQQGWLNMCIVTPEGPEIPQFSIGNNLLAAVDHEPDEDGDLGRILLVKKAIGAADSDIAGEYGYFGHWQSVSPSSAASEFGTLQLNSNHTVVFSADGSDGESPYGTGTWSLDSSNAVVNLDFGGGESDQLKAGQDGILMKIDIDPVEDDDLGYSYLVKKGSGKTLQSVAGRYLYQEFCTDETDNEPFTAWGVMEFELDGTWSLAVSENDGSSDIDSGTYTVSSDGTIAITNTSYTYDAVLSYDDQHITIVFMGQNGDVGMGVAQRSSDCNANGILDIFEIPGDIDGNRLVNLVDFAKLAEYWLEGNCGMCGCADIVCDGKVNMADLNTVTDNWLVGSGPGSMVLVPAGWFPYQNTSNPDDWVFVDSFMIGKYEVTNAEYYQFLNNNQPDSDSHWISSMEINRSGEQGAYNYEVHSGKENYPIRYVNYYDAQAYAAWKSGIGLTYRLPSAYEWEKAAGWDPIEEYFYTYGFHQDAINCLWCNYNYTSCY
ncbi:MAG: hypothetical protein DRP56_01395, partial [Planctomycetota bacterium]